MAHYAPSITLVNSDEQELTSEAFENIDIEITNSDSITVGARQFIQKFTIFVDPNTGKDEDAGDALNPLRTLSAAAVRSFDGGTIVLSEGSYGDAQISKNLTLRSASGSLATVGHLDIVNAQVRVNRIRFSGELSGITVSNNNIGAVTVSECLFENSESPVQIVGANYVSVLRNRFKGYDTAVQITGAREVCVSANIFCFGKRAVRVEDTTRVDVRRNSIYMSTLADPQ